MSDHTTTLTRHEKFWLDVIRLSSNFTDPAPTLWRAQMRLLFKTKLKASVAKEVS